MIIFRSEVCDVHGYWDFRSFISRFVYTRQIELRLRIPKYYYALRV